MTAGGFWSKIRTMKHFGKLEYRMRMFLSHYPVLYAMIAGIGLVLFWRGVWHTADAIAEVIWLSEPGSSIDLGLTAPFWDGPVSLLLGSLILLVCGVFVSELLGKEIIISGLRGERKTIKKTEAEVRMETGAVGDILEEVHEINHRLEGIEEGLKKRERGHR